MGDSESTRMRESEERERGRAKHDKIAIQGPPKRWVVGCNNYVEGDRFISRYFVAWTSYWL
jgi:hypothetical protein